MAPPVCTLQSGLYLPETGGAQDMASRAAVLAAHFEAVSFPWKPVQRSETTCRMLSRVPKPTIPQLLDLNSQIVFEGGYIICLLVLRTKDFADIQKVKALKIVCFDSNLTTLSCFGGRAVF